MKYAIIKSTFYLGENKQTFITRFINKTLKKLEINPESKNLRGLSLYTNPILGIDNYN